jgi:hypothetical protein
MVADSSGEAREGSISRAPLGREIEEASETSHPSKSFILTAFTSGIIFGDPSSPIYRV